MSPAPTATAAEVDNTELRRLFLRLVRPRPEPDPYPLYARLREMGPVLPVRFPGMTPRYLVTTYAECSAMLQHPAVGPLAEEHFHETNPHWRDQRLTRSLFRSMAFRSGAEHRIDRAVLARHFSTRRIMQRRAEVVELASGLLDRLAECGASGELVDIERELAVPYAALVIGRTMGMSDDQALRVGWMTRECSAILELAPSPTQRRQSAEIGERIWQELVALAAARRARPRNDLVSELVAHYDGEEERLISALALLLSAGFDSPASLTGLGLRLLLDHPEQSRLVRENPELVDTAIEEILRCEPPVQVMFRAARSELSLAGVPIPEGSILLGLIAGAGRDPALVADPDRFDVRRAPVRGLSFGGGAHYCLGAHLARLSASALLPALLARFPRMRLAGPPTYRSPGLALRGFERLPVVLAPHPPC